MSLDVASHAEIAESRPRDFLDAYPPPVILDEIRYAPGFFRHIKTEIDHSPSRSTTAGNSRAAFRHAGSELRSMWS